MSKSETMTTDTGKAGEPAALTDKDLVGQGTRVPPARGRTEGRERGRGMGPVRKHRRKYRGCLFLTFWRSWNIASICSRWPPDVRSRSDKHRGTLGIG